MQDFSDHELLALLQQGRHQAFSVLVDRHAEKFYRLAFRFLNARDLSQDVVQDAFLFLWEHPERWNPHRNTRFTTWFYRIIVNRCLDLLKRKRDLPLEDAEQGEAEANQQDGSPQEIQLLDGERQRRLTSAIARLPENQKTAINLCFFAGMSNREAAEVMEVSLKALQSLIMRAKTNIRKELSKEKVI